MKNEVVKQSLFKKAGEVMSKNSPMILTGVSVAGVITTSILAVQATPKALELIREREAMELDLDSEFEELTPKEIIETTWRCYIPATIMGGVTIACMVGATNVNMKRNAALASLYSITETTIKEYQSKVIETIGENKEKEVRSAMDKQKLVDNPVVSKEVIVTGKGDMMCYDTLTGRYFKSDIEKIRQSINELNRDLISEMFISVNDLYYAIGLDSIKLGDMLGWHVDDGLITPSFTSHLASDGTPCLVLDFKMVPKQYQN